MGNHKGRSCMYPDLKGSHASGYTHECINTYIHTCIHTYIHTYIRQYTAMGRYNIGGHGGRFDPMYRVRGLRCSLPAPSDAALKGYSSSRGAHVACNMLATCSSLIGSWQEGPKRPLNPEP